MKKTRLLLTFLVLILLAGCGSEGFDDSDEYEEIEFELDAHTYQTSVMLNEIEVETWMYQIQWLDTREAIDALDETEYDMLVVEPGFNFIDEAYDTAYMISALKYKPDGEERILLAYIDIGQAEDYRSYWGEDWVAPTKKRPGSPDFLVTVDPDGWSGNYPVAYWDPEWLELWLAYGGLIEQIVAYGFDGVYLDWVEAYDDDAVREAAEEQGIDPERAMLTFIKGIHERGQTMKPGFLMVPQNAPYLLDTDPALYVSLIDAVAMEDTWYYGEGDAEWDDRKAGDLSGGERHSEGYSTEERIAQSKKYLELGIPVFTVDYCIDAENANEVYYSARENGFVPLVTRVSLSGITETPPY